MAHDAKREWKARCERAETLNETRLAANKELQAENESLKAAQDQHMMYKEDMDTSDDTAEAHAEVYARVQAMPTWQPARGTGAGGGRAKYDFSYRVLDVRKQYPPLRHRS